MKNTLIIDKYVKLDKIGNPKLIINIISPSLTMVSFSIS